MVKNFLLAAMAAGTVQAMASEGYTGSQFLYQAPMDKIVVTPGINYSSNAVDLKNSTATSLKAKGFEETVRGEYGINEMMSAGLELSYANFKTEYSPAGTQSDITQKGLGDLNFFVNARMEMGPGSLRFGSDVNFALEKDITDADGKGTNNASGGISVRPYVAYEMTSGACTYGGKLSYYTLIGDRKSEDKSATPSATTSDVSGGQTTALTAFYEHKMEPVILGALLEWASIAKEKEKTNGSTSNTAGHSFAKLGVYVPYDVTSSVTLLPKVTYAQWTAMDTDSIDSAKEYNLEVAARFTF